MNKRILKSLLFVVVFFTMVIVYSQNPSAPNRTPPPPPGVPIDGGIIALLTVAVGYAVKKLRIKK